MLYYIFSIVRYDDFVVAIIFVFLNIRILTQTSGKLSTEGGHGTGVEHAALEFVVHLLRGVLCSQSVVFLAKVEPERIPLSLEGNRSRVWGVVDRRSVQQHNHAAHLDPAEDRPFLAERLGDEVENEQIRNPHGDGPEVVQDGVPDGVEQEGDQDGEEIVEENRKKVHPKGNPDRAVARNHVPRVEGIFERAMVVTRQIVHQRIRHKQTKDGAPEAFHPDEQQWRRGNVHGQDLFLKDVLQGLYKGTQQDHGHTKQRVGIIRRGAGIAAVSSSRQNGRRSDHEDTNHVENNTNPLERMQFVAKKTLFHDCHENDACRNVDRRESSLNE